MEVISNSLKSLFLCWVVFFILLLLLFLEGILFVCFLFVGGFCLFLVCFYVFGVIYILLIYFNRYLTYTSEVFYEFLFSRNPFLKSCSLVILLGNLA